MPLTLTEIAERLKQLSEDDIVFYLGITSEDLIERFADLVEEHADRLENIVEW